MSGRAGPVPNMSGRVGPVANSMSRSLDVSLGFQAWQRESI